MDKKIITDFIKKYWKLIVILGLFVLVFFLFNRTSNLEAKSEKHLQEAKEHEITSKFYKGLYDNLVEKESALEVKYDSLVLEKDKIKIQYHEKFTIINQYTVLDMQRYFDERTAE